MPREHGPSVVVTGGSGKAGRAVIRELLAHGYRVMNVDLAPPAEPLCHFMKADLNDLGQAMDCFRWPQARWTDAARRSACRKRRSTSRASPRRGSRQTR